MSKYKVDITGINTNALKVLKNDEMLKKFRDYQNGNELAKEDIVNGNLKLVLSIIKKYNNGKHDMNDLFQIGCIGLIKAVDNFDPNYGVMFSTYAVPLILGEVKRFIRDSTQVRIARSIRDNAYKIKEKYRNSQDALDSLSTAVKVAVDDESVIKSIAQLFNSDAGDAKENDGVRGYVQNQTVALNNIPNIVVTYYQKPNNDLLIEAYNPELLQILNKAKLLRAPVYLVCDEIKLSEGMIAYHFASIDELSSIIAGRMNEANLYLARAYDYALVQDFSNAIEDFSKAIFVDGQNALAYFSRANIRYKKLEFSVNNETEENANTQDTYRYEYEMIMRDYDKVIELAPDFAFVWYNRANLLAHQKDYQAAVVNYTKAIELEDDFSEAYFNRALTYLLLNQRDKAISDLSKAGELGIYKAYSILKKIQNK